MCNRVAQIFLWPNIPKREKYTEGPQTTPNGHTLHIPNGHKLGVPNGRKIYQYFPCQGPPNIYIPKLGYKPSGSLAIQGRWGWTGSVEWKLHQGKLEGFEILVRSRVASFFLLKVTKMGNIYQMAVKYTKWPWNMPNGHKIGRPNGQKIDQHLPLQDPLKFTQIGTFGLKTNHLATQVRRRSSDRAWLTADALLARHDDEWG
jgi:hypothetical protein